MLEKQEDIAEQIVVVCIEPSKRLSELCGFPYFIERRFTVKELLEKRVIDENDISEMRRGKQVSKKCLRLDGTE